MYPWSFSDNECFCPAILGHVAGVASLSRDQGLSSTGHSQLQLDPTPLAQLSSSDNLVTPLGKKIVERLKNARQREGGKKDSEKQQWKHRGQRRRGMMYSGTQSRYSLLPVGETPPQQIFSATCGGCTTQQMDTS